MRVRIVSGGVASTPEQEAKPFSVSLGRFSKFFFTASFLGTVARHDRIIF